MERLIAGLDARVFLMNNVHDDGPAVFHARWVMSYLRGPLTRIQIKNLMDPKRAQFLPAPAISEPANPMGMAMVPFESPKGTRPILAEAIDWENDCACSVPLKNLEKVPRKGTGFAELPGYAMNADNYKLVNEQFAEWIYRKERVQLFHSPLYDISSQLGESEGDFRARLAVKGREARDEAVEKLRASYASKLRTKTSQRERAELAVDKEKDEASNSTWQAGASILGGLLSGLLGTRKSRSSGVSSATRAMKQRRDVGRAEDKVDLIESELAELEAELADELDELERKYDVSRTEFEPETIKPYKKDIDIKSVVLLWLPYDEQNKPFW